MDLGLHGKRALVTGGTRGIGRAIAQTLLGEGASVGLCARNATEVERTVADLSAHGVVIGQTLDVTDLTALETWVTSSAETLGGVDIYVHTPSAKPRNESDDWLRGLEVDVLALVRGVGAAQPMLEDGGGAVVAIGSTSAAEHLFVGSNSYTALKAAAINWTLGQAQELGARGVRCNVVSPGPTLVGDGTWDRAATETPQLFEATRRRHPGGTLGHAQDVANVVVFVASDAARHVNGVHLTVDGGFLKRVDY